MKNPLKICLISHSGNTPYGAEKVLIETIEVLTDNGYKCYVMVPNSGELTLELDKRKIDWFVVPFKWWVGAKDTPIWKVICSIVWNLLMTIWAAVKVHRRKCDILFTNTIVTPIGGFLSAILRLPHIWYIHEFGYEDHGVRFYLGDFISSRIIDRLSSVCLANSRAVAEKYNRYIKSSKLKVVYYAVNVEQERIVTDTRSNNIKLQCVIVGRVNHVKGQEYAIRAVGELVKEGLNVELLIIGDGDLRYRTYLETIINEKNLQKSVKFTGYLKDPFSATHSTDIFLICSKCEAFGRVTIEAMKSGKPVIGARSGGTVELIRDKFNGFLYNPMDFKDLAEKIKYLYEHHDERLAMGNNAFLWSNSQFNEDLYRRDILNIMNDIAGLQS
jgi:glycosyltransferase involved in cell wall biosynthesis